MELRCSGHKLFGVLVDNVIEFRCQSKGCKIPGTVVIHKFSAETGKLLETQVFRDPQRGSK